MSHHTSDIGRWSCVPLCDSSLPNAMTVLASPTMEAAVWTAIGLLAATSLGSLFFLGSRMDALSARIDAMGARIDALSDRLDARFNAIEGRMDSRFANVDTRFVHIETRFDSLDSRLVAHLDRHAG